MSFIKRLLGQSVPVTKKPGYISFANDEYRIEKGPTKVALTFEEGESPADTTDKMVRTMRENGVKLDYLAEMRDAHHTQITTGQRLYFHQRAFPYVWKFYAKEDGAFVRLDEADLSEAEAIKWALKKIREQ